MTGPRLASPALRDRPTLPGTAEPAPRLLEKIERVAPTETSVLLHGETGTGKGFLARQIHGKSPRHRGPFVTVDCGAICEELFDSELFGHRRGAFTGARAHRLGKIPSARGGTLFLDGIDHLGPRSQASLLRTLELHEVQPLGASRGERVDFRLITSTSDAFSERLREGAFRPDLYYRIKVVELVLPPLRERLDELEELAGVLLEDISRRLGKTVTRLERQTLEVLRSYPWPGNIRELEGVLECAVASTRGEILREHDLPVFVRSGAIAAGRTDTPEPEAAPEPASSTPDLAPFQEQVAAFQRELLTRTLTAVDWSYTRAGERLSLTRHQVKYLCSKLGIRRPRF